MAVATIRTEWITAYVTHFSGEADVLPQSLLTSHPFGDSIPPRRYFSVRETRGKRCKIALSAPWENII